MVVGKSLTGAAAVAAAGNEVVDRVRDAGPLGVASRHVIDALLPALHPVAADRAASGGRRWREGGPHLGQAQLGQHYTGRRSHDVAKVVILNPIDDSAVEAIELELIRA